MTDLRPWAVAALLLLTMGASGCGGQDSSTTQQELGPAEPPETAEPPGAADRLPAFIVTPDTTLLTANYDTVSVRFGPGEAGRRIVDEPGFWGVDYTWFYLLPEADTLYTFEEMEKLGEEGAITDTTRVGLAIYRIRIEGASLEEVRAEVEAKRPPEVPPRLYEALARRPGAAPADSSSPR
jgi:hypothetical protein